MKNRYKKIVTAALAGLLIFSPVQNMFATADNAVQAAISNDSKLSELDISPGTLSPAFSPDVLEYTAVVDASVTSLSVRAIPRAAGGTIASVEGARTISPGTNTVKVTCSAPDNSYTVYSIIVTAGGTSGTPQGESADGTENLPDGTDEAGEPDHTDNAVDMTDPVSDGDVTTSSGVSSGITGPVSADGTVTLNGAAYRLSSNFSYGSVTQDIPSSFGEGSVQIGGNSYSTFYCEAGNIHLVYMENTDGNGSTGFYYYDEQHNAVERFKYAALGDSFVVFISNARDEIPQGYKQKKLTLPSGKEVLAYQNKTSKQMKSYYLIYGIYSDGDNSWYLYDKSQGTYMRYASGFAAPPAEPEETEPVERTVTLNKYNLQVEKYNELKGNMVKTVSAFIIVFLLLIIIFTAILFKTRDSAEDSGHVRREPERKKKAPVKTRKPGGEPAKNSLAAGRILDRESAGPEAKKITKKIMPDSPDEHISTPDEIRRQMRQEQEAFEQQGLLKKRRVQMQQEQDLRPGTVRVQEAGEQEVRRQTVRETVERTAVQQPVSTRLLKKDQSAGTTDSVQLAAEKMRQSVQFGHKNGRNVVQEEPSVSHDPMDDWEVEETAVRRKFRKKKRGHEDEDVEIMDLNDL